MEQACGYESLVGARRWHAYIDQRDVNFGCRGDVKQVIGGSDLGDDLDAALAKHTGETFAEENRVVCKNYAHGRFASICVPWPGWLRM